LSIFRHKENYDGDVPHELVCTRSLDSVQLKFNLEAGALLPLACKGRVLHGRHFTFKSVNGDTAVTFVATGKLRCIENRSACRTNPHSLVVLIEAWSFQCRNLLAHFNCLKIYTLGMLFLLKAKLGFM